MDIFDDVFAEAPVAKVPISSRFKPRPKAGPKKGTSEAAEPVVVNATEEQPPTPDSPFSDQPEVVRDKPEVPTSPSPTKTKDDVVLFTNTPECPGLSETPAIDDSSIQNEKEVHAFPDVSFASSSPLRPCTTQTNHDLSMPSTYQDSDDFQINVEQLEAGDFSSLDAVEMMNDTDGASGKRTSKLKPKPMAKPKPKPKSKAQDKAKHMLESLATNSNANSDQSPNTVFEDTVSLTNPDMLEQGGKHGNFDGLNSPGNQPGEGPVLSDIDNENTYEFVDGTNNELRINSKSPTKAHDELASNGEENHNGDDVEVEKSKKKRGRRSKKAVSDNDKPTRKRKKASQEPDKSIQKPPKKFPRGTRRKRCVDKRLLEIPEEDLDLHRLPIKDLILLAEHKEREAKKQANSVQTMPTDERTDDLQSEGFQGFPYDDDGLEYDQDRDMSENPSTSGIKTDTGYYNYHTFRKIQPRAKWSKKDTEMFYQGIRQFGTDLSMIHQLFPGRSLEQIRSKYRKEQKQNPMMMDDAQTTRATDNSCFELVIKALDAKREAEMEYASSEDDLAHPTGKDGKADEITETHATSTAQEAANSELNHKDENVGEKPDTDKAGSPVETYDYEDDWDDYTGL